MNGIGIDAPGTSQLLLGNEAIARGALEAGIGFAGAYPGTPSSEILPAIASVAKEMDIRAEWCTNEKVALESAIAASLAGIRAISSMKQNGFSVVSDLVSNLNETGIGAGLVLVICDDPGNISSSAELDTRFFYKAFKLPVLEPSSAQECKDMTKWAFDLAEELDSIVIVRSVTRISHTRENVEMGELLRREKKAYFPDVYNKRNPKKSKFTTGPGLARLPLLHQKLAKAQEKFESLSSNFNWYKGPDRAELVIITSGSCVTYSSEAVKELKLEDRVGVFKLGTTWPLPEELLKKQLSRAQKILFIEEMDPFIEGSVMELAANLPPDNPVHTFYGKRSGHIRPYGDMAADTVIEAVAKVMGITYQARDGNYDREAKELAKAAPTRPLDMCPGCPHRATFWAIKEAFRKDKRNGFVCGDIGCYSMGFGLGGFYQSRTMYAMGAGPGLANGMGKLDQFGFAQPVIGMCGDSTFFHASIPALVDAAWNRSNIIFMILDNDATAMTGFQPHPGTGKNATIETAPVINMDALCRSLGVPVEVCDPFNLKDTTATLLRLITDKSGPKVVIMRRECELQRARKEKKNPFEMHINPDICKGENCRYCQRDFHCPGLIWNQQTGKAEIDEAVCVGCGLCADICPFEAITKEVV